ALQKSKNEDLSQASQETNALIADAAKRKDTQAVTQLAEQQRALLAQMDDNYKWVQDQLSTVKDSSELQQVAAGFATGGLLGGLEGLQSAVNGRRSAGDGALLDELQRRLKLAKEADATSSSGPPAAVAASAEPPAPAAHLPSPLTTLPHVLTA